MGIRFQAETVDIVDGQRGASEEDPQAELNLWTPNPSNKGLEMGEKSLGSV